MHVPFLFLHRPVSRGLCGALVCARLAIRAFQVLNAKTVMNLTIVQQHILGTMLAAVLLYFFFFLVLISTPGTNYPRY